MRRMLWVTAALVLAQSAPLTLGSDRTDRYFAWTIDVPLTAAFLGAAYLAAGVLEVAAARQRSWDAARSAVPGVWVFTTLTLAVTLAHLDRFHLDAASPLTRALTWGWVGVYAAVPLALGALWWRQALRSRDGGPQAPAAEPLPPLLRHGVGALGLVLLVAGGALLARPDAAGWWPWPLTVLTAQAVGAWLVGLGVVAVQTWSADRLDAGGVVFPACAVLAVGQLVVLLRFADDVRWGASAAAYALVALSLAVVGLAGTAAAGRARRAEPRLPAVP